MAIVLLQKRTLNLVGQLQAQMWEKNNIDDLNKVQATKQFKGHDVINWDTENKPYQLKQKSVKIWLWFPKLDYILGQK